MDSVLRLSGRSSGNGMCHEHSVEEEGLARKGSPLIDCEIFSYYIDGGLARRQPIQVWCLRERCIAKEGECCEFRRGLALTETHL